MEVLFLAAYVALCLLVAVLGRATRLGYWGTVVVAFVVTPFLAFVFLVLFARPVPARPTGVHQRPEVGRS
jgi:hypothetical protein